MKEAYDVVVIGSGFGGAINACRLAQAGRSVCLLERGKRWGKKDFPRTTGQVARSFWNYNDYGLLDYRTFSKIDVIQASGVGGGSLVYFNVHIRTPKEIFEQPRWPAGVKRDVLDPFYDKAKEMLEAEPLRPPAERDMPNRTQAFFAAARGAGREAELVDICVYTGPERVNRQGIVQDGCVYCGNCMLGCHVHAKNTLDLNYIPLAEQNGAEVYPLHLVEKIEPVEPVGINGYRVHFKHFSSEKGGEFETGSVTGRKVIISAGSLGSTEILLRGRDLHRTLARLSPALGTKFSGNGDFLLAGAFDANREVDPGSGPSITAGVVYSTGKNRILIEDLGFPDPFLWYLESALPVPNRLKNLHLFFKKYFRRTLGLSHASAFTDGADKLFQGGVTPRFLPYLGIGTDAADGEMKLSGGNIDIKWDSRRSREMFKEMESALKELSRGIGGRYKTSILWGWPLRKLLTAHPLGGCVMSDDPKQGVVNEYGEVWNYPNLYVSDGAIIPTALSVNPSATISALSERIADHIAKS
ncbi:MAG TPA: GMC family oxidoreductase [Pyrinomonadaceae bacterium]|nr:GMC family oxidoreductase [Pyrinomonadaceae bacterium]